MEPTIAGRRLDVGGFVLADPFELVLRQLSEPYLQDAWQRLEAALARWQVAPRDLSWGWLHPGETHLPGLNHSAPSSFVGWSSRQLADFDHDARLPGLDTELRQGRPAITYACTWRSLKWRIVPDNVALGLRLVEAFSTNEVSEWDPAVVVGEDRGPAGAWHAIASAILAEDQHALDRAVALARQDLHADGLPHRAGRLRLLPGAGRNPGDGHAGLRSARHAARVLKLPLGYSVTLTVLPPPDPAPT